MPKIFERDGYRFFFYSNDHVPIHVHVRYGSGEAVFDVEQGVELRESHGLKGARLDTGTIMGAEELVPRPRQSNL